MNILKLINSIFNLCFYHQRKQMNYSTSFDIKVFGYNDYDEIIYLTPFGAMTYQELKKLISGWIDDNINIDEKMKIKVDYNGHDNEKYYTVKICDANHAQLQVILDSYRDGICINDNTYLILTKRNNIVYGDELSSSDEYDQS